MTPEEFAMTQRTLEERALQQVAMLQRIAGYLNQIVWAAGICCFLLLFILLSVAK